MPGIGSVTIGVVCRGVARAFRQAPEEKTKDLAVRTEEERATGFSSDHHGICCLLDVSREYMFLVFLTMW